MRQLVYTMFISNNRASFHLWCKENLVKHQKVSKYYKNGCSNVYMKISILRDVGNDVVTMATTAMINDPA